MRRILILLVAAMAAAATISCGGTTTAQVPTTAPTTTVPPSTTLDFSAIPVTAVATNKANRFQDLAGIAAWTDATSGTLSVDDLVGYEPYRGTGAALTYAAAWVIDQSPQRDEIIEYLFGEDGLHVQLVRLCIGASDFTTAAAGHYTYDDTVGNVADPDLSEFSIEKDRIIVEILQDALEINPDIVFMAAPWSAPAWMKTNKSLYGGSLAVAHYGAYAQYLIRYLEAYADAGIDIDYLSVQNEPYYAPGDYPGMTWSVETTKTFIRDHLGPALEMAGRDVRIMIWDHNPVDNAGNLIDFPVRVLQSAETAAYVGAIGVHCYTGDDRDMADFLDNLRENAPDVEVFMTECTASTSYTDLEQNMEWSIRRMYVGAYARHAVGTTYWNLALDPLGATHLGGCGNCTGLVSVMPASYRTEADGYVTAHFARYVRVGATRISVRSFNSNVLAVGYLDDAGTISLVVWNDAAARGVTILWRGRRTTVPMPANALVTVRWTIPETE
ncbi:MAG: glycoside hydrolase family 30 beta sandwich domain-containing protein [Candidatus Izemoplasmatales bacterium]